MTAHTDDLLAFLGEAVTPFHAVSELAWRLSAAGFTELTSFDGFVPEPGRGYFFSRNDSSIIAFRAGEAELSAGLRLVGAHTDSPNLSVKPNPVRLRHGVIQLAVDVYGGALLNPWFDRDLSMAGKVTFVTEEDQLATALIDFRDPIALIPSLAIHLDREANSNRTINPQRDILPILACRTEPQHFDFLALLAMQLAKEYPEYAHARVLDFEMSLYDTQKPAVTGLDKEFLSSARLDNLLSCYCGLRAVIDSAPTYWNVLVCTDHEEVGSASVAGAQGPMLNQFLEIIQPDPSAARDMRDRSWMLSVDNAHGIHPNFADRHDENHGPLLNAGPVIKINRNQRYATSGEGAGFVRLLAERLGVPVQSFVVRADMACGSTIGPITATETGIPTIDIGLPTWSMHSIRETAGAQDPGHLIQLLTGFFERIQ
jgi:aspartyl aminopeptidase